MFKKDKHKVDKQFNPDAFTPAVRISICTGEKVLGFINKNTGKFYGVTLAESDRDIEKYCKIYSINREDIRSIY